MAVDTAGSAEFSIREALHVRMKCNGCSSLSAVFVLQPVYRCTKTHSPREEKDKTPKMVADPEAGGYALYNITGVPAYGDARGAGIRNILGFY